MGHYPDALIKFLSDLPEDSTVLLRRGNKSDPGLFEQVMAKACSLLWMSVEWFTPDPEDGKGATFLRDVRMVESADLVLAYFASPQLSGGTMHVVEAAVSKDTPVYAWGLDIGLTPLGAFRRIGEWDEAERWSGSVPQ